MNGRVPADGWRAGLLSLSPGGGEQTPAPTPAALHLHKCPPGPLSPPARPAASPATSSASLHPRDRVTRPPPAPGPWVPCVSSPLLTPPRADPVRAGPQAPSAQGDQGHLIRAGHNCPAAPAPQRITVVMSITHTLPRGHLPRP